MTVIFSKKIYTLKSIKEAIKDYKSLAKFAVSNKKNSIQVVLKDIDKDFKDVILDEFCNYVLYKFITDYKHERSKS